MASRFMIPFGRAGLAPRNDPFFTLHREMNRLFDDTLRSFDEGESTRGTMAPSLDVHESESEFCLTADLPGVAEQDIDVQLEGDTLTIRGEKKQESERDERGYHVVERRAGNFQRSIRLPFEPDPEKVTAECHNGVLTVHVSKQGQQQRTRRIEVKRGEGAQAGAKTIEGRAGAANDPQPDEHQMAASHSQGTQAGEAESSGSRQANN
jgi:HSP20 family protein